MKELNHTEIIKTLSILIATLSTLLFHQLNNKVEVIFFDVIDVNFLLFVGSTYGFIFSCYAEFDTPRDRYLVGIGIFMGVLFMFVIFLMTINVTKTICYENDYMIIKKIYWSFEELEKVFQLRCEQVGISLETISEELKTKMLKTSKNPEELLLKFKEEILKEYGIFEVEDDYEVWLKSKKEKISPAEWIEENIEKNYYWVIFTSFCDSNPLTCYLIGVAITLLYLHFKEK